MIRAEIDNRRHVLTVVAAISQTGGDLGTIDIVRVKER